MSLFYRKLELVISSVLDVLLFILAIVSTFFLSVSSFFDALLIIVSSIHLCIKSREHRSLLLLFSLYAYMNISLSFSDILGIGMRLGDVTLAWQENIRSSSYKGGLVKYIVLFTTFLSLLLSRRFFINASAYSIVPLVRKDNALIFYGLYGISLLFWIFGYSESRSGTYESVTRPIYEYCLAIFPLMWFYSGSNRMRQFLLIAFIIIYVAQSLMRGDRSSAFPMLILAFLISQWRLNLFRVAIVIVAGLLLSNLVGLYRLDFTNEDVFELSYKILSEKSFTSDTVSQSFYTAITIFAAKDLYDETSSYFGNFLVGVVLGGWYPGADVINLAGDVYLNKAGGFYFSWFYFWFGMIGAFIAALVLAMIIRGMSLGTSYIGRLYQMVFVVFFIRWYVYTPFVLFRSVLFVFGVLLVIAFVVDSYTRYYRCRVVVN